MDISTLTPQELLALVKQTPDGYARFHLGLKLHPKQEAVLNSLFLSPKTKVSVLCANEVGKTSFIAVISILYAIHIKNAMVVSTAAVYRQITKQLIPYLKQYSNKYPDWDFQDNNIKVNGESRYIGFATSEDSKFQGFHETDTRPLLIIIDEAAGVPEQIFQSIARCNPTWLLVMGSPLGPEGIFYQIETDEKMHKQYTHFKITKHECLKKDGWWLDEKDINDFISMWTPEHPLVKSSVFADFSTNVEGGLITLDDIEKSLRNPAIPDYTLGRHVALDFAAGGDENIIAFRDGNNVRLIKCWRERDTMLAAREFVNELDELRRLHGITATDVTGDADGLGGPIIDRIKELGWNINRFHGGSSSDDVQCRNKITDAWVNGCRKIRNGSISIPRDQQLIMQLLSRKSFMNQSGKLQLESKEDMKARGIPSPDRADAILMCIQDTNTGLLTQVIAGIPSTRHYTRFF